MWIGPGKRAVGSVFRSASDTTIHGINAAVLLGSGPRKVILKGLPPGFCEADDELVQGENCKQIHGRIGHVDDKGAVVIETSSNHRPDAEFKGMVRVRVKSSNDIY